MSQLRPLPVRDLVVRRILSRIVRGMWPPGSKLPAQEELAHELGVGRSPVREAVRELETLGIVTTRHGLGVFVRESNAEHIARGLVPAVVLDARAL